MRSGSRTPFAPLGRSGARARAFRTRCWCALGFSTPRSHLLTVMACTPSSWAKADCESPRRWRRRERGLLIWLSNSLAGRPLLGDQEVRHVLRAHDVVAALDAQLAASADRGLGLEGLEI